MNVSSVGSSVLRSTLASSTQEALETAAQTKAEAAKGDQQAVRKLAREQSAQDTQTAQPAAAETVPVKSLLDAKA
jgi:hypothetical protein